MRRAARRAPAPRTPACRRTRFEAPLPFTSARELSNLPDDEVALDAAEAVDEQRAVQMIHLVLKRAGEQPGGFVLLFLSVPVERLTTARDGRTTVAVNPGTLRQPSSSSCVPSRSTNSGLIRMRSPFSSRPTEMSTTNTLSGTPIWGAASPTPGAAYIVWIMSSTRRAISGVMASTTWAFSWRTASPYLRMGRIMNRDEDGTQSSRRTQRTS